MPLLPRRHPSRTCTNVAHDFEGAGYAEGGNMAIEDPWVENSRGTDSAVVTAQHRRRGA